VIARKAVTLRQRGVYQVCPFCVSFTPATRLAAADFISTHFPRHHTPSVIGSALMSRPSLIVALPPIAQRKTSIESKAVVCFDESRRGKRPHREYDSWTGQHRYYRVANHRALAMGERLFRFFNATYFTTSAIKGARFGEGRS
jgi:hypothetical protein